MKDLQRVNEIIDGKFDPNVNPGKFIRLQCNPAKEACELNELKGLAPCETPTVDPNLAGKPNRYFYGIGHTSSEAMRTELYDALIKNDLSSMTAKSHSFGEDHYVNEPIFVPAPGATTEDEGVLLVLLYNGFLHPMTIMVALPLSIGGALMGLLIGQKELGLFALIGVVLLMGIVTKNSILLVDYALMNKEDGKPRRQSALEAGISRLRPILMTALATIAGMIPIALELGAGSEVRSPMAIAVIGGFTTSTLLTLVVVPVIFTYVDSFQEWFLGLFSRQPKMSQLSNADSVQESSIR